MITLPAMMGDALVSVGTIGVAVLLLFVGVKSFKRRAYVL